MKQDMDELFRSLLDGVGTTVDTKNGAVEQSRQLVTAFSRIEDHNVRQELLLLIELVSRMPKVLTTRQDRFSHVGLANLH
ncbi:hypothetical protein Rvan_2237 [Rhodomicrobium vannielii ATCC 17100]|jgi:hypothetical protein|uniref:Uncharacterized protein n=2 Tax=Rhodomicrobium TaxID=1068 RepID=E3I3A1_RHOVT|nr:MULTISPECIES: hypothetical protein [Rhodomicrobium]ADP71462.1 hypothetical protein Rvan_2237 [Rhodomicrobium vannielii ATCC 17100]KAI93393.1 hypothetical protein T281_16970 [Rhodomicrobium udaipurense JA643]MBJ7543151.1 hypothetical protein [Rhodomicrobium udaipurense]